MVKPYLITFGLIMATSLAACSSGSGSGGSTTVAPVDQNVGDTVTIVQGSAPNTHDVTFSGVTTTYSASPGGAQTINGFTRFAEADPAATNVGYHTETSDTYAGVAATISAGASPAYAGVNYGRSTPTSVPTTGSATYVGNYAGLLVFISDDSVPVAIDGTVTLNVADFPAATIAGSITDRDLFVSSTGVENPVDLADVALTGTISADGTFSGTTTGGESLSGFGGPHTADAGTFEGIIGGATGSEVVGGLEINHRSAGALVFYEIGAFSASQ